MGSRVDQIIEHEREADRLHREGDAHRWEAARLIAEELDSGTTQETLADQIGKSQQHTGRMAQVWREYGYSYMSNDLGATFSACENALSNPPAPPAPEGKGASKMPAVKRAVRAYVRKHGRVPSSRAVARELGDKDDRSVRAAWDGLAERGELPERPRSASAAGAAGQLLDNAIEYLRGFVDRAVQATDEEKAKGTEYWLTRLATINSLTDEAHRVITGEAVDDLIRDIQEKER